MINKMNRSMAAKLPEEKKMESLLNEARNSEELKNYAENLRKELSKINIAFYSYRVKKVHSAVRSFRIANYQKLEDIHDLFGVLVVVEDKKDIAKIADIIKKDLKDYEEYNLLTERDWIEQKEQRKKKNNQENLNISMYDKILADLKKIIANTETLERVLPPLSDIIIAKIPMGDKQIPVEFRIQDKNGFQIIESYYFTLYKNDELDPKMKGPLLFLVLQLLNRKNQLDTNKNLSMLEREELINQIGDLYQYNFNLLCTNREVISDVWREYVKISVKYALQLPVYDFHFFGIKEKTDEDIMELIEKDLDKLFEEYKSFDIRDINTKKYIEDAIKMLQIETLV